MTWFKKESVSELCEPTEHRFEQPVYKPHSEREVIGYLCTYCGLIAPAYPKGESA
jgi:hypothetical protein